MSTPTLVLLAGPTCSGKSSLGNALQKAFIPEVWLFWQVDSVAPRFPPLYHDLQSDDEPRVREALAIQRQLLRAELNAIRSYLEVGFNMIVERWLWDEEDLAMTSEILGKYNPFVVELRCSLETLERRETERGTTFAGFARHQAEGPGWLIPADLILDSEAHDTDELVEKVRGWLKNQPKARGLVANVNDIRRMS